MYYNRSMDKSSRKLTKNEKWVLILVAIIAIVLGVLVSNIIQSLFFR